jgi:predicted O-methyltransferase YrrM
LKIPTPLVVIDFLSGKLGFYSFRGKLAAAILNRKAGKCAEPMEYVNLCFDVFRHIPLKYIGWPLAPVQIKQEIGMLLSVLTKQTIHTMLEIGTAQGGTLFLFSRIIDSDATMISLDLPGGKFGGGYEEFKIPFFTNFAQKAQRIFLVRANSHSPSTLSTIKSILKGQKLDFLFIDGDHTYEGVKEDFHMYGPLVRKCGLIAFHDICKGPPEVEGEVNKFWKELKCTYKHQEIINVPFQKGYGIGVLYV